LAPLAAFTGGAPSFEDGKEEAIANLTAPGFESSVNIEVPAGYYVTNATMNVTGLAAENNASAYPEGVTVKLNGSVIWAFQQTGFGPLGKQNQFSTGQKQVNASFGSSGGISTQYIRLPKDAMVQSATMEIKGFPPSTGQELVNFTGSAAGDHMGYSVSNAGDVNSDGYDDVIVGAIHNSDGGSNAGQAYVFYCGPDMDNIADVTFTGKAVNDYFGDSVSSAGDVNGDGYDDVIIGAGANGISYANIYFGGQNMDNNPDVTFTGESAADYYGRSVSGAGDVNGDGYDDVIVGAYWYNSETGRAYIYYGGANMDNAADVILTGGDGMGAGFGASVSSACDVNNDGYADVIVGEPYYY